MKMTRSLGARARSTAAIALALASTAAFAESTTGSDNHGAMTFANVKVVDATTPAGVAGAAAPASAGMRVQKDKDTGELRAPTAAEVAEVDAHATSAATPRVTIQAARSGGHIATLDESFMSYDIVRKDVHGKLVEHCVTGESTAERTLRTDVVASEVDSDR